MFKKLYAKINTLSECIANNFRAQSDAHSETRKLIRNESGNITSKLERMSSTIVSQQRTIEQLTNALKDKYEHGMFIFSEDCKIPTVIRNGKELTNNMTSCFSIEWVHGETPNITIEQFAGTISDMEN